MSEWPAPQLPNTYEADVVLRDHLERVCDPGTLDWASPRLKELGDLAPGPLAAWAEQAERHPPVHVPYDGWTNRIDEIRFHPAWHEIGRVAREWGLAGMAYETDTRRLLGKDARTVQYALCYLFNPSSATYSCPVAMTDAAAKPLELFGSPELKDRVLARLISRDESLAWTSGQWMTERTGGSDVGETTTRAANEDGVWRLHGDKWFCSSAASQVALALARPEGAPAGTKGLALFAVPQLLGDGSRNRIRINRLKEKLGTRALATAEMTLEGAEAWLVGDAARGFAQMTEMLNLTRLHNAIGSCSGLRRGLQLARAYANVRTAFGRKVADHPLQRAVLMRIAVAAEGCFALTFRAAAELGAVENGAGEPRLLRILTPLAKYYTARRAVWAASHVVEAFGGPGYVEDTGIPRVLRDAQVLPIWEGTSNVISLDVLRSLARGDTAPAFLDDLSRTMDSATHPALRPLRSQVALERDEVAADIGWLASQERDMAELVARRLARRMAECYIAAQLLAAADWALAQKGDGRAAAVAQLWVQTYLDPPPGRGIRSGDRTAIDKFASVVDGERIALG
jgi:alkylation response protein AidB-like acyl-CoA dehydrogenase